MTDIHRIIFENSKDFAGKFRERGVEVGIRNGFGDLIHLGAPATRVIPLLTELIKWYNKNKNKLPAIVLAVVVHNQFEYIHPFEDGNGRVGRLLLNNILLKHKLPPVNISIKNRKKYYDTLKDFQKKGDIKPSIELILKEYKILKKKLKK
jgi:Fic family protein